MLRQAWPWPIPRARSAGFPNPGTAVQDHTPSSTSALRFCPAAPVPGFHLMLQASARTCSPGAHIAKSSGTLLLCPLLFPPPQPAHCPRDPPQRVLVRSCSAVRPPWPARLPARLAPSTPPEHQACSSILAPPGARPPELPAGKASSPASWLPGWVAKRGLG